MMILSPINTTFICPCNDAESATIIEIVQRQGFEVRISKQQNWFCPLDNEPDETFENLKENVVIVEMPGEESERRLAVKHQLIIIDHHGYPALGLNRENSKSSIEQMAELIDYELNHWEKGIAINDQEYIYGLLKNGYSEEEIKKIRELDLKMQGYTDEEFQINTEDQRKVAFYEPNVYEYKTSIPKFSYLIDLHVIKQRGKFSNVLVTGFADAARGKLIFFSGAADKIIELKKLGGYSKLSNSEYGLWGGYEYGVEQVDIKKALDVILN